MGHKAEVHQEKVDVHGYGGRNWGKAQVIVRKVSGLYADVGFEKTETGKYKIHIDSMDERRFDINKVKQLHAKHKVKNYVKKHTGKYQFGSEKVEQDGRIRIKLRVRS
jgi:hypothetical protein